jgi:CheY-like chemotaxis protein
MSYSGYHKLRALVVDDFDSFRMTVVKMLESFGVEDIDTAVSGNECLRWCAERNFDLILCDYNLGRGKNGQQVLEELRYKQILNYQALFILISAESSRSIIMSAYDYEPDAYLAKPITGKVLKQRLDRLLWQRDELTPIYLALEERRLDDAANLLKQKILTGSRVSSICQKRLGELYLQTSQLDLAEQVYRQALETRTLDWAKVGMAKVRYAMGKSDEARQWLDDILQKNPLCMQAYDALADILRDQKDQEKLNDVLTLAVEYSPMALLRQERLAQSAVAINDHFQAAKAYRQTIRLGANSCHDKRDNHINFGRATANLLKESDDVAADLCREAINVLEDVHTVFQQSEEESVQTLFVESQILTGQGNHKKATEVMAKAEFLYQKLEAISNVDTELDYVQSLNTSGEVAKADALLKQMVKRFHNNQAVLEKIDRLLEEPISDANRTKVSELNREGIARYEMGEYKQALSCFKNAKKMFPNHLGIQLNFIQAIEGEIKEFGFDSQLYHSANTALMKVKKRISGDHPQYDRYLQLQDMLKDLKKA